MTPADAIAEALSFMRNGEHGTRIGVAVSGGSDSLATLILAHEWAGLNGCSVHAVTVDHGLRAEAADEIAHVAQICARLGVSHDVLVWDGWDDTGNLQAAARHGRYWLMDLWSSDTATDVILLGHTADDLVETFLMRLARGSGVDGLSGMAGVERQYMRPLLGCTREDLRAELTARRLTWCDDPSNSDDKFDRVKARKMMGHLSELGLTRDRVLRTIHHMDSARTALQHSALLFVEEHVVADGGDLLVPAVLFERVTTETGGRVISAAIQYISDTDYRPRYDNLQDAAFGVVECEKRLLQGVVMEREGDLVRMSREVAAALHTVLAPTDQGQMHFWESRWGIECIAPSPSEEYIIRALGEAITEVPNWRDAGLPRASLMASPAVFDGNTLIAAPVAGLQNGFEARIVADFASFLVSR